MCCTQEPFEFAALFAVVPTPALVQPSRATPLGLRFPNRWSLFRILNSIGVPAVNPRSPTPNRAQPVPAAVEPVMDPCQLSDVGDEEDTSRSRGTTRRSSRRRSRRTTGKSRRTGTPRSRQTGAGNLCGAAADTVIDTRASSRTGSRRSRTRTQQQTQQQTPRQRAPVQNSRINRLMNYRRRFRLG